jgi:hypothetical protein
MEDMEGMEGMEGMEDMEGMENPAENRIHLNRYECISQILTKCGMSSDYSSSLDVERTHLT